LALKWSDIDWQARTVTIQRALIWRYKPPRWYFSEPKTSRSRRTIPLSPALLKQLSEHKRRQGEERLRAGARWQQNALVFPKWHGGPQEPSTLRLWFQAALKRAALPTHFRLYDLRHSCASLLMAEGLNPKVVSERLGHSSVAITLDVYSHVLPGMQQEASERLENLLFGALGTL
jgi:integrase